MRDRQRVLDDNVLSASVGSSQLLGKSRLGLDTTSNAKLFGRGGALGTILPVLAPTAWGVSTTNRVFPT